jgi:hypothetical protein
LRHGCPCAFILCLCCCLQVVALWRAHPPSKEHYRLCKISRNWKSGQGPTKGCRATDIIIIIIIINYYYYYSKPSTIRLQLIRN